MKKLKEDHKCPYCDSEIRIEAKISYNYDRGNLSSMKIEGLQLKKTYAELEEKGPENDK